MSYRVQPTDDESSMDLENSKTISKFTYGMNKNFKEELMGMKTSDEAIRTFSDGFGGLNIFKNGNRRVGDTMTPEKRTKVFSSHAVTPDEVSTMKDEKASAQMKQQIQKTRQ